VKTVGNRLWAVLIFAALLASVFVSCDLLFGMNQNSSQSKSESYGAREKQRLMEPGNIEFDREAYKLTWSPVVGAVEYAVTVKFNDEPITDETRTGGTTLFFEPDLFTGFEGRIIFYVQAIANAKYEFEDSSAGDVTWDRTKIKITEPENVQFDRGTGELSWDVVEGADRYVVRCWYTGFDETWNVEENAYVFDDPERFVGVTPINFTVTAITDDPDMKNSEEASLGVSISLDKASGFSFTQRGIWEGGTVKWNPVVGAGRYEIYARRSDRSYNLTLTSTGPTTYSYSVANHKMEPGIVLTFYVTAYPSADSGYSSSQTVRSYTWK
jgi:hypothetical protein